DSKGTLWVGTGISDGVWRLKPGPPQFFSVPATVDGVAGLVEDGDGTLLIGAANGIYRLADGKTNANPLPGFHDPFHARVLLRDRDGGLWIGTSLWGIIHTHDGRTDVFTQANGLSGDGILDLFEDREGNIWVATADGLDRFREYSASTFGT